MKVINVCFVYDDNFHSEEQLFDRYYSTVGWAEALQKKGIEVIVVQRFCRDSVVVRNKVKYHFVRDSFDGQLKPWQIPLKILRRLSAMDADVIHLHSTLHTSLLRFLVKRKTVIVVQNHGGPRRTGLRGLLYRFMDSNADGLFFTTNVQGKDWYRNGNLIEKVLPVMEGANSFTYSDREAARKKTALTGSPILLWVGHLNENKDPFTVLGGFRILLESHPMAKLYMIFGSDQLLPQVRETIGSADMEDRVILIGKVPHNLMEDLFNSADFFVLGSHFEGSGYSLSEALACGCIPIVTDIPSFRMMTNDGKIGGLWKVGDKNSFAEVAVDVLNKPLADESLSCREFYQQSLSFDAIADTSVSHYKKLIEARI